MLKFICIFFGIILSFASEGQANLPTSYGFDSLSLPNGWKTKNTAYYSASGNTPPALKFDNSADYLEIHFEESPGVLSYFIVGNLFSGGDFIVEESINGSNWSVIKGYNNLPTTYTLFHDTLNENTRFIRFKYLNKAIGNVGLDDVSISLGANLPYPKLRCSINNIFLKNGSSQFISGPDIGELDTVNLLLENIGNVDLLIDSVKIIEDVFGSYSFGNILVSEIDSMSVDTLKIVFNPTVEGSNYVLLYIYVNNSDVFKLNLKGIAGEKASEPIGDLSNLYFSDMKTYSLEMNFEYDKVADGFLVLKSNQNTPLSISDGVSYKIGNYIGDWMVVSNDTSKLIKPKSILANTNYFFKILAYNGQESFLNYNQSNGLEGNIITPVSMQPSDYYSNVILKDESFLSQLTSTISNHTSFPYSDYTVNILIPFEIRDTLNNQYVITCVYSGEKVVFDLPFDWSETGFSREHSYCHNWMPSNPSNNPEKPEYQDLHHLFPVIFKNVNETRSNYPLGEVDQVISSYFDSKFGYNNQGELVFEPRDQHKGDAARCVFYMCTAYHSNSENWSLKPFISSSIPYGQNQYILKKWNLIDPPSNWEIARNDYIASVQGNRNPFIDHPEFACDIDFYTMSYMDGENCSKLGVDSIKNNQSVKVIPNPTSKEFKISVNQQIENITMMNQFGEVLFTEFVNSNEWEYEGGFLRSGVYFLKVQTKVKSSIVKLVVY